MMNAHAYSRERGFERHNFFPYKFEVLCTVAEALGKIGGPQAIEAVVRVLSDSQVEAVVQQAVARALAFAQRQ